MNYIIFDLEWNQSPDGKKHENKQLPFEIIEIGAVKMNENNEVIGTFQRLIKPQVYKWIHSSIHEVIHMNYCDLAKGIPFPQAVQEFLEWCGPSYYFFTWGNQDVFELQRNMKYYQLLHLIPGPVVYYDIQKLFSLCFEDGILRRSLEYAIDYLNIDKREEFHRALADAHYTTEILQQMNPDFFLPNSSLDVYQNPKSRKEEIFIKYPTYNKYVSREFNSREHVMKDHDVISTSCPVCKRLTKRKIRWFINNSKVYYNVSCCREHGYVLGKIKIRKTDEEKYFSIKTMKCIDEKKAEEIRDKRDSLRLKRQSKKRLHKEIS